MPDNERKYTYATTGNLQRGASKLKGGTASCGCLKKEVNAKIGERNKKYNKYDLETESYGIGYVDNSEYYFLFDKEDYDLIKDYCWHKHRDGYLRTRIDNRKENLRESNHSLNMKNIKLSRSNTSGHKGVSYAKRERKWKAYIHCDKQKYRLGTFENYEDAVRVREEAEKKYFGEFNRDKEFLTNEEKRCG